LDLPTSFHVLETIEDYPRLKEENQVLREMVSRQEALDEIRKEREALYQERIRFLEEQNAAWSRLNEATLALAKQNREAQGTWFDRFRKDLGTFALGGIAATAIIAAIAF
jgi:FtsZ-binding cell division protein ZapB